MGQSSLRLVVIAFSAVCFMASVPLLIRFTSASIETISVVRLAIALLVVTPLMLISRAFHTITARDWVWMLLAGLCFGVHWWTFAYAVKTAGAGVGAIAMSTFGIHLLLLNHLIHRQTVRPIDLGLVAVCVFGCYLVVPRSGVDAGAAWGFLVGVVSAFFYGALPLFHRRLIHLSTLTRTWGQFAFGGLFFLALWPRTDWQLAVSDWWALAALGVVGTLLAHSLWVKASSELPGVLTGGIYYLHSPMAVTLGWLVLNEQVSARALLGMVLIIVANLVLLALPWLTLRRQGVRYRRLG